MLLTNRTGVKNTRDLLRAFGGLNETYGCTEAEYSGGMNFSARDFPPGCPAAGCRSWPG